MAVSSSALTSRQRLKDFLDISADDSTTNNVLDRIIDSVTDWVEGYCGRNFKRQEYSYEYKDGTDSQVLLLDNYPIDTSQTFDLDVRTSGDAEDDDWDDIDSEDYFIYEGEGILEYPRAVYGDRGRKFVTGNKRYRIKYTAGYYLPQNAGYSQGSSTSLPGDLEYVVWKLCAVAWNSRRGSDNVKKETIGDYSVTYAKEAFEDEKVLDILNKYARQDFGYRSTYAS